MHNYLLTLSQNCGILTVEREVRTMVQVIVNGQPTEVTEHDYREIINLLLFKERLKKSLDKGHKLCYNKGTKKRGNDNDKRTDD